MSYELYPGEQIKQITGYPNYFITTFGRVWSQYRGGHWLKPTVNIRGNYRRLYVSLGRGNKFTVHKLVAEAFIENPNNYPSIDHIDGDATNNKVENLRWTTHQENMQNPNTLERVHKNGGALFEIEEISTGKLFWGYEAAADYSGLHKVTIQNHTEGRVKNPRWRLTGRRKSYTDQHIIEPN